MHTYDSILHKAKKWKQTKCPLQHVCNMRKRSRSNGHMVHDPTHGWAHCFLYYLFIASLVYGLSSWCMLGSCPYSCTCTARGLASYVIGDAGDYIHAAWSHNLSFKSQMQTPRSLLSALAPCSSLLPSSPTPPSFSHTRPGPLPHCFSS